jgi:hypothetical protein
MLVLLSMTDQSTQETISHRLHEFKSTISDILDEEQWLWL